MQSCTYAYIIFYAHAQVCVVPKTIHTSPTEEIFPYTPPPPLSPPPPPTHWGIFNPFHGGSMDIFNSGPTRAKVGQALDTHSLFHSTSVIVIIALHSKIIGIYPLDSSTIT